MLIHIIAKPKNKRPGITQLTAVAYEVRVAAPPIDGRANAAIISALADYFHVKNNQVFLRSGRTSINKTFELVGV